jgi:hypothetical protein
MNDLDRSPRVIALVALMLFPLVSGVWGCRSEGPPASPGDGGTSSDAAADSPGPAATCLAIRTCIFGCGDNKPCAERCVSGATAAALPAYRTLEMCTRRQCPTGDEGCRCDQECYSDGMCFDLAVECANAASDPMCEELCH